MKKFLLVTFGVFGLLRLCEPSPQDGLVRSGVLIQNVGGGIPYRIVLDVNPTYLLLGQSAMPPPTLFVGNQPIFHTLSHSGTLLEGFIAELPVPDDTIWFASTVDFPDIGDAKAHFDASGVPPIPVNVPAMLAEGERQRKRITGVQVVVESTTLPDGTEETRYVVKLTVENCDEDNFAGFGPLGLPRPPDVVVGDQTAQRTFFSIDERVVVGEFAEEPEDGAVILLQYAYWSLRAPTVFHLP